MDDTAVSKRARALSAVLEPIAGQVYFSPECHDAYASMGFGPSTGQRDGVALPDPVAYFTSRGSLMGQVPGTVVAAAFAVFNPAVVVPAVAAGWARTDAATIEHARTEGALAQLHRLSPLDETDVARAGDLLEQAGSRLRPEGRPLYGGVRAQDVPDDALGRLWRLADRLREYRGDCHTAAWTSAGFDAVEIGMLTELYWGLPLRSYARTRAWSDDDFDAAEDRLAARGLVSGGAFTPAGRDAREEVERATDRQCAPIVDALDERIDELLGLLRPLAQAVRDGKGYPAAGPQDLAAAAAGARR